MCVCVCVCVCVVRVWWEGGSVYTVRDCLGLRARDVHVCIYNVENYTAGEYPFCSVDMVEPIPL